MQVEERCGEFCPYAPNFALFSDHQKGGFQFTWTKKDLRNLEGL